MQFFINLPNKNFGEELIFGEDRDIILHVFGDKLDT